MADSMMENAEGYATDLFEVTCASQTSKPKLIKSRTFPCRTVPSLNPNNQTNAAAAEAPLE
jgi:hypothetical protein